jgi:hypothetical protein
MERRAHDSSCSSYLPRLLTMRIELLFPRTLPASDRPQDSFRVYISLSVCHVSSVLQRDKLNKGEVLINLLFQCSNTKHVVSYQIYITKFGIYIHWNVSLMKPLSDAKCLGTIINKLNIDHKIY